MSVWRRSRRLTGGCSCPHLHQLCRCNQQKRASSDERLNSYSHNEHDQKFWFGPGAAVWKVCGLIPGFSNCPCAEPLEGLVRSDWLNDVCSKKVF